MRAKCEAIFNHLKLAGSGQRQAGQVTVAVTVVTGSQGLGDKAKKGCWCLNNWLPKRNYQHLPAK